MCENIHTAITISNDNICNAVDTADLHSLFRDTLPFLPFTDDLGERVLYFTYN